MSNEKKSMAKQLKNQREAATNIGIDVDASVQALKTKNWKEKLELLNANHNNRWEFTAPALIVQEFISSLIEEVLKSIPNEVFNGNTPQGVNLVHLKQSLKEKYLK